MDKAKQTIAGFMSHNNEHKTTVDQDQRAAITEEHIRPQRHEEVTTAIDKEIHQDHHQTILQPIKHQEQLAEKHIHNAAAVQHKTFEHDKPEEAKAALDADAAKYRDSSVVHDTEHSQSVAPTIQGEHVHHHLHQHVQPVIQKDTIAPEVVHTTVPIHEVHHARSINHGTTTLPAKTLQEFETEHGLKTRPAGAIGEFDGCAKTFVEGEQGSKIGSSKTAAAGTTAATTSTGSSQRVKSMVDPAATGTRESRLDDKSSEDYKVASQAANRAFNNDSSVPRSSAAGAGVVGAGAVGTGAAGNQLRQSSTSGSASSGKVSLKDKLNPFKDADGDGKKGLMS